VGLKILVVDDSKIIAMKLCKMIEEIGHEVAGVAKTGEDAISMYRELLPDLVTMDITMPGMGGIAAMRQILSEFPKALIIMVTSHGQQQMVMDAINSGAKGYILKPIQPENLQKHIAQILQRYRK